MTIRKLTDSQVKTCMHILIHTPEAPTNLERFPTLRMLLENNIITKSDDGKLWFNTECPENAYQYIVPADFIDDAGDAISFDEMEKAGLIKFPPNADPREVDETDLEYRQRLSAVIPQEHTHSATAAANACGKALNAIGSRYKCYRLIADTFFFYDCVVLCQALEKLGAAPQLVDGKYIVEITDFAIATQCAELIEAFNKKYPPQAPPTLGAELMKAFTNIN